MQYYRCNFVKWEFIPSRSHKKNYCKIHVTNSAPNYNMVQSISAYAIAFSVNGKKGIVLN